MLLHNILPPPPRHHVPDTLYSSSFYTNQPYWLAPGPSGGQASWGEEMLRGQQANSQVLGQEPDPVLRWELLARCTPNTRGD